MQQVRVLAEESEPRTRGQRSLQKRHSVDKASRMDLAANNLLNLANERLQPRFYHIVVIESPGVAGHTAIAMLVFKHRRGGCVVNGKRDQRLRVRRERKRVSIQLGSAGHVVHARGKTLLAPLMKCDVLAFERFDRCDAGDLEAKLPRRLFDLRYQFAHAGRLSTA